MKQMHSRYMQLGRADITHRCPNGNENKFACQTQARSAISSLKRCLSLLWKLENNNTLRKLAGNGLALECTYGCYGRWL